MAQLPVIQFQGWRDREGYRLVEGTTHNRQRIVRNGRGNDSMEPISPLKESKTLYRLFAKVETPDDLLRFVRDYGLLTLSGLGKSDDVGYVMRHARLMRDLLKWIASNQPPPLELETPPCNVHALVVWDRKEKTLRWELRPSTLLDALWLQFGQAVTRGDYIRTCTHCGEWFEAGRGTSRRLDAKFCCDEHRTAFNSLKRSKGGKDASNRPRSPTHTGFMGVAL